MPLDPETFFKVGYALAGLLVGMTGLLGVQRVRARRNGNGGISVYELRDAERWKRVERIEEEVGKIETTGYQLKSLLEHFTRIEGLLDRILAELQQIRLKQEGQANS